MTAEHLLDAMGLLDDGLIQEAERYVPTKRRTNYGTWLAWAASFALVLVLGYGVTHLGIIGSGGDNSGGNSQAAPNASGAPNAGGAAEWNSGSTAAGSGMPETAEPQDPASTGAEEEYPAIMIGGVVYRSTGERIPLFPEGDDIRYDVFWYDEESGEASSGQGLCYLTLEDGSVAVSWHFQSQGWLIFAPVPTGEP